MEIWFNSKRTKVMLSWDKTELEIFLPHFPFIFEKKTISGKQPQSCQLSVRSMRYSTDLAFSIQKVPQSLKMYRTYNLATNICLCDSDILNLFLPKKCRYPEFIPVHLVSWVLPVRFIMHK